MRLSDTRAAFEYVDQRATSEFTGVVNLVAPGQPVQFWYLYLQRGALIWSTRGAHPWRRLRRHLWLQTGLTLPTVSHAGSRCSDLALLLQLVRHHGLAPEMVRAVASEATREVWFDIARALALSGFVEVGSASGEHPLADERLPSSCLSSASEVVRLGTLDWEQWRTHGLNSVDPNCAPVVSRQHIERHVRPDRVAAWAQLLDGSKSLRDMAVYLRKPLLKAIRVLAPYEFSGVLNLRAVADLHAPKPQGRRPRLVYVDDSPSCLHLVETVATASGYRFTGLGSGVELLDSSMRMLPDLVLLDVVLPDTNGYDLCRMLRRHPKFESTPIGLVTGNAIDRVRAKLVGATTCLAKPIDCGDLRRLLNRYRSPQSSPRPTEATLQLAST